MTAASQQTGKRRASPSPDDTEDPRLSKLPKASTSRSSVSEDWSALRGVPTEPPDNSGDVKMEQEEDYMAVIRSSSWDRQSSTTPSQSISRVAETPDREGSAAFLKTYTHHFSETPVLNSRPPSIAPSQHTDPRSAFDEPTPPEMDWDHYREAPPSRLSSDATYLDEFRRSTVSPFSDTPWVKNEERETSVFSDCDQEVKVDEDDVKPKDEEMDMSSESAYSRRTTASASASGSVEPTSEEVEVLRYLGFKIEEDEKKPIKLEGREVSPGELDMAFKKVRRDLDTLADRQRREGAPYVRSNEAGSIGRVSQAFLNAKRESMEREDDERLASEHEVVQQQERNLDDLDSPSSEVDEIEDDDSDSQTPIPEDRYPTPVIKRQASRRRVGRDLDDDSSSSEVSSTDSDEEDELAEESVSSSAKKDRSPPAPDPISARERRLLKLPPLVNKVKKIDKKGKGKEREKPSTAPRQSLYQLKAMPFAKQKLFEALLVQQGPNISDYTAPSTSTPSDSMPSPLPPFVSAEIDITTSSRSGSPSSSSSEALQDTVAGDQLFASLEHFIADHNAGPSLDRILAPPDAEANLDDLPDFEEDEEVPERDSSTTPSPETKDKIRRHEVAEFQSLTIRGTVHADRFYDLDKRHRDARQTNFDHRCRMLVEDRQQRPRSYFEPQHCLERLTLDEELLATAHISLPPFYLRPRLPPFFSVANTVAKPGDGQKLLLERPRSQLESYAVYLKARALKAINQCSKISSGVDVFQRLRDSRVSQADCLDVLEMYYVPERFKGKEERLAKAHDLLKDIVAAGEWPLAEVIIMLNMVKIAAKSLATSSVLPELRKEVDRRTAHLAALRAPFQDKVRDHLEQPVTLDRGSSETDWEWKSRLDAAQAEWSRRLRNAEADLKWKFPAEQTMLGYYQDLQKRLENSLTEAEYRQIAILK